MNRWIALAVLLVLLAGIALRVPQLDERPLHNDEAVNAVKVSELWLDRRYAYDPHEYHGPTLHYATVPFLWLTRATDNAHLPDAILRAAPVLFGVALILLVFLFDGLPRRALLWAALFTALSPAMVFYSRYFIHEMLLVVFTAGFLGSLWRYRHAPHAGWAIAAGVSLGLMSATKETFVITLVAMILAAVAQLAWGKLWHPHAAVAGLAAEINATGTLPDHTDRSAPGYRQGKSFRRDLVFGVAVAAVVWFLFFTSLLTHWRGPLDSVLTYLPWMARAGGESPHIHPWYFYLQRLAWFHPVKGPAWSEGLVLILALVGIGVALFGKKSPFQRYLAFYVVILTAAYSFISYKTPWCLLSFYHGMILLAGLGASTLVGAAKARWAQVVIGVVIVGLAGQLGWQAWRASFVYASDRRNPYVYAQTVPDLLGLVKRLHELAAIAPDHYETVVKVVGAQGDYWPLPWYLRQFKNVGWYDELPADPYAPLIVVSSKLEAGLDDKSNRKWVMVRMTELRPGNFLELYVEFELWKKFVATLPREVDEP